MLLQRIANPGLFLGDLFEDALRRNPYQRIWLDHELDVAAGLGRELTVYDCALLIADLARGLADAGVGPGDLVALYKQDAFDVFLIGCAISRAGGVPVMLAPALSGQVVSALLDRAGWPWLVTDDATLATRLPPETVTRCRQVLVVGRDDSAPDSPGTAALRPVRGTVPREYSRPHPDTVMVMTHTSGTTDIPKLVVHTAATLGARYRPQATAMRLLVRTPQTVAVHVSFVHSRLVTAMAIALRRQWPLVILREEDPERAGEILARHKPGIIEAHPNTFVAWEPLARDPREPFSDVTYVSSTFDAIHPRTVSTLLAASRRPRPSQLQLYGQSEVGPVVGRVTSRDRTATADGRCVGFPFPGMTAVRVVPRGGLDPSPEHPGFIEVRTDGRALTYHGQDERYRAQLDDGWWRMGDVGYLTRWGCLHICDREVDVIPGIGSALELEDRLMSRLECLLEVVIIPDGDHRAVPVVVTRHDEPLDPERWRQAVAGLPPMRPPVHLALAELPRTATAKVRRLELAERLRTAAG